MSKIKAAAAAVNQHPQSQSQHNNGKNNQDIQDFMLNENTSILDENQLLLGGDLATSNNKLTKNASKGSTEDIANSTLMPSPNSGSSYSVSNANAAITGSANTQNNLPEDIAIMEIILRFLQLLCENHNHDLQNNLRIQPNNKTSYNLVCETLQFLDCICGSTTGGLGLLGLWINENNVHLINQALESLTEYCQGPCHANQFSIINHESNGIDIVIALILNDIQPLSKNNLEMFLALKDNASKLLLAVMESNDDTANAERILYNITPKSLIDVIREAYEQGKEMDRQAELAKIGSSNSRRGSSSSDINNNDTNVSNSILNVNGSSNQDNQPKNENGDQLTQSTSITDENKKDQSLISANKNETSQPKSEANETNEKEALSNIEFNQQISVGSVVSTTTSPSIKDETESQDTENSDNSEGAPPREVGHNLYILAHKLAKFNKELSISLKSKDSQENEALAYYAAHTAQIEIIREDRAMEQIVFPVPTICEYLTKETKQRIFLTTEKDEQNSKITGFFEAVDQMWNEMKWQRKLRQQTWLYWFSSHMSLWSDISFNFAVLINLLVAIFYPFQRGINVNKIIY